jgi:hypothetical protein
MKKRQEIFTVYSTTIITIHMKMGLNTSIEISYKSNIPQTRGAKMFQKSSSHTKILGGRRVT